MAEEDAIMAGLTGDESVAEVVEEPTITDAEVDEAPAEETEAPEEEVEAPASEDTESEEPEAEAEQADDSAELDQKELARQAYLRRQEERKARDQALTKAQEEHLAQAQDEADLAFRQLQIDAYTNKVTTNSDRLTNQYEKAINDIEIFRNPTPEIAEALGEFIDEFQDRYVQLDELGNPVAVTGNLYEHLTNRAALIQKLSQVGARKEKAATAKQRSAVTPPPAGSPKEPKTDPIMEGLLSQ